MDRQIDDSVNRLYVYLGSRNWELVGAQWYFGQGGSLSVSELQNQIMQKFQEWTPLISNDIYFSVFSATHVDTQVSLLDMRSEIVPAFGNHMGSQPLNHDPSQNSTCKVDALAPAPLLQPYNDFGKNPGIQFYCNKLVSALIF